MGYASTVYIARHGERIDHVNKEWLKTAPNPHDPFLTERGIQQANALGKFLKDKGLTHIFASPFYRTVQTANEVAKETGLSVCVEPGLGEFLNRDWFEHRPVLKSAEEFKKEFDSIDTSYVPQVACRYPETKDDVVVRSCYSGRILTSQYGGATILLVGHGMTCEFLNRGLCNVGLRPYISYCSLQTCSLKDDEVGTYTTEDIVDISFMDEAIRPIVKKTWGS